MDSKISTSLSIVAIAATAFAALLKDVHMLVPRIL